MTNNLPQPPNPKAAEHVEEAHRLVDDAADWLAQLDDTLAHDGTRK